MKFAFHESAGTDLSNPANWKPAGGPPGPGDLAILPLALRSTGNVSENVTGSLTVGAAEFVTDVSSIYTGTFNLERVRLSTTNVAGILVGRQAVVNEMGGAIATNALTVQAGTFTLENGGTLQTAHVSIEGATDRGGSLRVSTGHWTNLGNVEFAPNPTAGGIVGGLALDIAAGTATIGGSIMEAPGAVDSTIGVTGSLTVGGDVTLSYGGSILVDGGGVFRIAGDLAVNATDNGVLYIGSNIIVRDTVPQHRPPGTLDVGHNIVLGGGAGLFPQEGGVIIAENRIALLANSHSGLAGGTIEAPRITLDTLASLGTGKGAPGPSFITGVGGGTTSIFSAGVITSESALTVNGDVIGNDTGTIAVGVRGFAMGDLSVNGTLAHQDIQFGVPGSTLFAGHFAMDAVEYFAAGDIIATPGVQSIAYDPTSHTLSMDKGGGTVESLHMAGDFTGQQFVLSQNEYITLQPATA